MITSPTTFLSKVIDGKSPIPKGTLAYFRERQRNKIYNFIVSRFLEKERKKELTRSELARRIHKSPEQITRILASPGNWESDTISDLALAVLCGDLDFMVCPLTDMKNRNSDQLSILQSSSVAPYNTRTAATYVVRPKVTTISTSTVGPKVLRQETVENA